MAFRGIRSRLDKGVSDSFDSDSSDQVPLMTYVTSARRDG